MPSLVTDHFSVPRALRSALGKPAIRPSDWERWPGALTRVAWWRRDSWPTKTERGEQDGPPRPPVSFVRKAGPKCSRHPATPSPDIPLERTVHFGASAPDANPQKTEALGSARNSRAADVNLNGQRVGELNVFLDRAAALDRGPGKSVEVRGRKARALTGSIESV